MTEGEFRAALLDPAAPVPSGLTDAADRPAGRRFAVYRNNVAVGLTAALEEGFPVLRRLLGDRFFAAMAGVHLRAHPPRSPLMMHYGADMPDFLATFPPLAHLPYLADVARLELALRDSYHAADAAPLDPGTVAQTPPDQLHRAMLRLAPPVRLIRSAHPIHAIWCANTRPEALSPRPGPQDVVILRPGFDPEPHAIAPPAADFIAALQAGATIGAAADRAGEAHDLIATLSLLMAGGALIQLELSA